MPNVLINSSFETGALAPWVGFNATVTLGDAHQGFFKAELAGGALTSFISQFIPVTPGDNGQLILSLAKADAETPSPQVSLLVAYLDVNFDFLETGLSQVVPLDGLPFVSNQAWKTVYSLAFTVPPMAAQASILIVSVPAAGTSTVLVDDVELVFG